MVMNETVLKINRILEGLIGCSLEFHPSDSLTAEEWDRSELELLRGEEAEEKPEYLQSELAENSYGFPLNYLGTFAGLAVVRNLKNAKLRDLLRLAELITVALENSLEQEQRRANQVSIEASNVIPLRKGGEAVLKVIDKETLETDPSAPLKSLSLLIETQPDFPLQRIAVEIHQLSGRWAMVGLEDLPKDVLDTRENLKEMGAMTIFIRDVASLKPEQQLRLAEYLAIKPSGDMPQIIAGIAPEAEILNHLRELFFCTQLDFTQKSSEEITSDLVKSSLQFILEKTREKVTVDERRYVPFHIQHLDSETFH